jgi:hypothetical protein
MGHSVGDGTHIPAESVARASRYIVKGLPICTRVRARPIVGNWGGGDGGAQWNGSLDVCNATRPVWLYLRPDNSGQEQVQRMVPESISPRRP